VPSHPIQVADPERIRAMAHPTRLELLDFLSDVEVATATECAAHSARVGGQPFLSPADAREGRLRGASPQRGREKTWRKVSSARDLRALCDRFAGRAENPSIRPPGSAPGAIVRHRQSRPAARRRVT
jgi:hypothetical protein